jgi:hypothetical protein
VRQLYAAGDWFAVRLGERAVAVARIAQHHRGIVYAYVFAPPHADVPALADVEHHRAGDAVTDIVVSHLALRDGAWPVIGCGTFDPAEWPERRVGDRALGTAAAETSLRRLFGL